MSDDVYVSRRSSRVMMLSGCGSKARTKTYRFDASYAIFASVLNPARRLALGGPPHLECRGRRRDAPHGVVVTSVDHRGDVGSRRGNAGIRRGLRGLTRHAHGRLYPSRGILHGQKKACESDDADHGGYSTEGGL